MGCGSVLCERDHLAAMDTEKLVLFLSRWRLTSGGKFAPTAVHLLEQTHKQARDLCLSPLNTQRPVFRRQQQRH